MNKIRDVISTLPGLLTLVALAVGCSGPLLMRDDLPTRTPTLRLAETDTPIPTPQPTETDILTSTLPPTATPWPTDTPVPAAPTLVLPLSTTTPIPASQMRGEWRRITAADGLCTDWPVFIGVWYIGTGTTTVCYSTEPVDETIWPTITVPLGTRVTAVDKFPPGGGEMYATDAGVCWYDGVDWRCQTPAEGYPNRDIRRIDHINDEEVLMLADAIVYREETYSIPEIVGVDNARPTWISVSDQYAPPPFPRIWVGTSGYGVVVIQPATGVITHHTAVDGFPGDVVRDIDVGADIWVATDNGVGRWDGERWTAYTTTDGLPSNDIRGVAMYRNTVWAATAGGAAYFDGQSWQAFTHEDGLPEGELNGVRMGRGEVWFSTRGSGLLVFVIQAPTQ